MRVADYVVEFLTNRGISSAYVVTGRGALFLNDALARDKQLFKVFPHHEQSAVFAACAAASYSREPQAVIVSTGCASTNVVTGVLSAWQDHLPVIIISGQNTLAETTAYTNANIRTYGQQEANILPVVETITKYACMVTDHQNIRYHLERAYHQAISGIPGPVWIDIPLDIQNAQVEPDDLAPFDAPSEDARSGADFSNLCTKLEGSERPVFLIGGGVVASSAQDLLKSLSAEHGIPIVYTHSAVDTVPMEFPNTIGALASQGGSRAGAFAVQNADLVLVLGSRLNSLVTGPDACKFARAADVFAVDIDPNPHQANSVDYSEVLICDVLCCLQGIQEMLRGREKADRSWIEKCQSWKERYSRPQEFTSTSHEVDLHEMAGELPNVMGEHGVFVCDSGFIDVIIPTNAPFRFGQRCIRPVSQGAMGFAIPAIIGVGNCTEETIYCIVGDGSIMFNIQELETIRRYNMNVRICIITNNMYAVIKRRQKKLFRDRIIGVDDASGLENPNFEKIADAFNIHFVECTAKNYLGEIRSYQDYSGPVIFRIPGKVEQEYLEIYHARTAQRKFVRRPLEDQKPFMNRDEFLQNMIVEPIDQ